MFVSVGVDGHLSFRRILFLRLIRMMTASGCVSSMNWAYLIDYSESNAIRSMFYSCLTWCSFGQLAVQIVQIGVNKLIKASLDPHTSRPPLLYYSPHLASLSPTCGLPRPTHTSQCQSILGQHLIKSSTSGLLRFCSVLLQILLWYNPQTLPTQHHRQGTTMFHLFKFKYVYC